MAAWALGREAVVVEPRRRLRRSGSGTTAQASGRRVRASKLVVEAGFACG